MVQQQPQQQQQHRIYILQFRKGEPEQEVACKVSQAKGAGRRVMYYYQDYGGGGGGKTVQSRALSLRRILAMLLLSLLCVGTLFVAPVSFLSFVRTVPRAQLAPPRHTSIQERPRLVIVSRTGSRVIENEADVAALAADVGFDVRVIRPDRTTELCKIYRELNASDAMVGVHGAAMTHFLFMRPGKMFIQVVPLGTDWAAGAYYGEPAARLGLRYVGYKILPEESSLSREYPTGDPVLTDPAGVAQSGWDVTKKVYLDRQNVRLDLARFREELVRAHQYLAAGRRRRPRASV